jgi:hypothetical protein
VTVGLLLAAVVLALASAMWYRARWRRAEARARSIATAAVVFFAGYETLPPEERERVRRRVLDE